MFELPTVHIETESGGLEDPAGPYDPGAPPPNKPVVVTPKTQGPGGEPMPDDTGTCVTATCISFVTVGYCIVVIVLAVAYRKHRPRDRSKQFDREIGEGEDDTNAVDDETEVLNPVFEQHVRNTGGGSVRGYPAGGGSVVGGYPSGGSVRGYPGGGSVRGYSSGGSVGGYPAGESVFA